MWDGTRSRRSRSLMDLDQPDYSRKRQGHLAFECLQCKVCEELADLMLYWANMGRSSLAQPRLQRAHRGWVSGRFLHGLCFRYCHSLWALVSSGKAQPLIKYSALLSNYMSYWIADKGFTALLHNNRSWEQSPPCTFAFWIYSPCAAAAAAALFCIGRGLCS